jgi:hypothetical protein
LVLVHQVFEVSKWHQAQQLCKHRSTRVHTPNLSKRGNGRPSRKICVSNRRNHKFACRAYADWACGYRACNLPDTSDFVYKCPHDLSKVIGPAGN